MLTYDFPDQIICASLVINTHTFVKSVQLKIGHNINMFVLVELEGTAG